MPQTATLHTVAMVTRYVVLLVAVLTAGCGMIEAGEVEGPSRTPVPAPAPSSDTSPAASPGVATPLETSPPAAQLTDQSTGQDMVAELDAMDADLAALDELLADGALDGTEP